MIRSCEVCGRDYQPTGSRQRSCGPVCARVLRAQATQRWRERNPALARERSRINGERERRRVATDPEYRAKVAAQHKRRYDARRAAGVTVIKLTTPERYAELHTAQDGKCAICRQPETARDPSGRIKRLAVDHDRETGRIRGLLCARCNTAIGLMQHDEARVRSAVAYLSWHRLERSA